MRKRFEAGNTSGFESSEPSESSESSKFSFEIEGAGGGEFPSYRKGDAVESTDARVDNESNIQVHRGDRGRVFSVVYINDDIYTLVQYDNGAKIVYMDDEVDYSIAPFTNEVDMSA